MESSIADPQIQQKVAAALLIIQVVVVISVFVGAVISGYWSRNRPIFLSASDRGIFSSGVLDFALLLVWLLLTIIPILVTPFFKIGWDALGFNFSVVEVRQATKVALLTDIILCSWFIFRSGGWNSSPFVSVVGALPAFAILIGEPLHRTIWYVLIIIVLNGAGAIGYTYHRGEYELYGKERARHGFATWLLAAAMLLLTTALGYIRSLPFA